METTNLENMNNNYTLNNTLINNRNINIDEILQEKKKHLEHEIRKAIETEFLSTQTELRIKHKLELEELNEQFILIEKIHENEKIILKENLNKYIEESVSNKLNIDNLNEELKIKDKEIENFKHIISLYQKSQKQQLDEISNSINTSNLTLDKDSTIKGNKIIYKTNYPNKFIINIFNCE